LTRSTACPSPLASTTNSSDAADQPAAADRQDHSVDVRDLLGDLESERSLTGDDLRVVGRVNEDGVVGRRERPGVLDGRLELPTLDHDPLGVVAGTRRDDTLGFSPCGVLADRGEFVRGAPHLE
jgi:hypothetical protein